MKLVFKLLVWIILFGTCLYAPWWVGFHFELSIDHPVWYTVPSLFLLLVWGIVGCGFTVYGFLYTLGES